MERRDRSSADIQPGVRVVMGDRGAVGTVESVSSAGQVLLRIEGAGSDEAVARLELSAELLERLPDGTLRVGLGPDELRRRAEGAPTGREAARGVVVPLVEEQLHVARRAVETGRVAVEKSVTQREEAIDEPLVREELEVRRVPINRVVDGPVSVREEGDEVVIPLLEEVLVVEKKLMLREEVRVARRRSETRERGTHTLRREEARVRREGGRRSGGERRSGKPSDEKRGVI